jgi:Xaa-Pro aminopeptidase
VNKLTKYINENEIEEMFQAIIKSGRDIRKVIKQIRDARTEFQIKSQQLQWKLEEYLEKGELLYD